MAADHLRTLNAALADEDDRLTAGFHRPAYPVTFLIGLPRAGKTLFHQAVATALDIGYVSNLLNKFWRAPYLGACLERDVLREAPQSSFQSHYGNTSGAGEPGEWGWFWQHWLGLEEGRHHLPPDADLSPLLRKLAAVEAAKRRPLLFNNMYAVSNLALLHGRLDRILVIDKPRDPYWVCSSIINARVARNGDIATHFANRPREMPHLAAAGDPVEEVVLQVKALLAEISAIYRLVGPDNIFTVDHDCFLSEPGQVLAELRQFWSAHGVAVDWTGNALPDGFANRNDPALLDPVFRDRLECHFHRHFVTGGGTAVRPRAEAPDPASTARRG